MKRNLKKLSALLIILALCIGMVPGALADEVSGASIALGSFGPTLNRGESFTVSVGLTGASGVDYDITALDIVIPLNGFTYTSFALESALSALGLYASASVESGSLRIAVRGSGGASQKLALTRNTSVALGTLTLAAGTSLVHGASVTVAASGGFHRQDTDAYYTFAGDTESATVSYSPTVTYQNASGVAFTNEAENEALRPHTIDGGTAIGSAPEMTAPDGYTVSWRAVTGADANGDGGTPAGSNYNFSAPVYDDLVLRQTNNPISYTISYSYDSRHWQSHGSPYSTNYSNSDTYNITDTWSIPNMSNLIAWRVSNANGSWVGRDWVPNQYTLNNDWGNVSLTAMFAYRLNLSSVDHATVTLTSPAVGSLPARTIAEGSYNTVASQTPVTVNITPDPGYQVSLVRYGYPSPYNDSVTVYSEITAADGVYTFPMFSGQNTVYVTMVPASYAITDSSDEHVTLTVPETGTYNTTVNVTLTPDTGYQVDTVTVTKDSDGSSIPVSGEGNTRTFTMPAEPVTVTTTSSVASYNLSVVANGGVVNSGVYYFVPSANRLDPGDAAVSMPFGSALVVGVTPADGYTFTSVTYTGDGTVAMSEIDSNVWSGNLTMPAHDTVVTFNMTPITYNITFKDEDGTTTLLATTYNTASASTLADLYTATKPGYTFTGWTVVGDAPATWTGGTKLASEPLAGHLNDVTLKANFEFTGTIVLKDYKYAGNNMSLLLVGNADVPSGKAMRWDEGLLFTTTDSHYQALIGESYSGTVYCFLVHSSLSLAAHRALLSYVDGTNQAIARTGDVDGNGVLNANDWGLVNDILADPTNAFVTSLSVKTRLECDVATGAWVEGTAFGGIDDVAAIMYNYLHPGS